MALGWWWGQRRAGRGGTRCGDAARRGWAAPGVESGGAARPVVSHPAGITPLRGFLPLLGLSLLCGTVVLVNAEELAKKQQAAGLAAPRQEQETTEQAPVNQ